ncbi:hypothetical protein JCM10213v2_008977 [Rhodosporidiobolus nylandii]
MSTGTPSPTSPAAPALLPPAPSPSSSPNLASSSSSSRLSRALALQRALTSRLEDAQIQLATRRRLRERLEEREKRGREGSEERQRRAGEMVLRIRELEGECEKVRDRRATKERAVEAMDRSHLVSRHMLAVATIPPDQLPRREANLQALLSRRDQLALSLLRLQASISTLNTDRLRARKKLLSGSDEIDVGNRCSALNRQNAELTQELRRVHQPPEVLVQKLPREVREYYSGLQDTTLTTLSRLSIIRNVLQRLIAESGVPFYTPTALPPDTTLGALLAAAPPPAAGKDDDDAPPPPLDPAALLRLMMECGDTPLSSDPPPGAQPDDAAAGVGKIAGGVEGGYGAVEGGGEGEEEGGDGGEEGEDGLAQLVLGRSCPGEFKQGNEGIDGRFSGAPLKA